MTSDSALETISIQGFKSIASVQDLRLGPINVLIGANGSGKSNFIGAFSFLHAIREGRLQSTVTAAGGAERLLHFGSKITEEIAFHLGFSGQVNQYRLRLKTTDDDSLYPFAETAYYWARPQYAEPYSSGIEPSGRRLEAGISNPQLIKTAGWVRTLLGGWRVYHVHDTSSTSPMRKTAKLDDNEHLRADGSNLAAFLYVLQERHSESYSLIRRTVQMVAPFFDDFRLRPNPLQPESIKLEWRHRDSDLYFDAASLSDGTLRFIALATLFLQPKSYRPSTILVDEPELGLHPYAIGKLAALVRQVSVETQVIDSTQSSLLLDYFEPEEVLVAERVGGATQIQRLDAEPLAVWLADYSLGQLWEKNEIGGRHGKGNPVVAAG